MSGRNALFIPGPTNMPDAVRLAMDIPLEDQRAPVLAYQRGCLIGAQHTIDGGERRTRLAHDAMAGSGSVCVAPGSR